MPLPRTHRSLLFRRFVAVALLLLAPLGFAKPVVVSSNTLLDDFVRTVGGDAIEAHCLLTPGRDPHTYDPTPADVRQLAHADLLVINGLGFETWLEKLIRNSGFHGTRLTASDGIAPLHASDDAASPHDHAAHGSDGDHDHGDIDPHAWHDLRHAARYVENIRDALAILAPAQADAIRSRAKTYLEKLASLDALYRERIAQLPLAHRKLVTSHDSLRYLGHAYGLEIIPISGLRSDQEPSARQLARIITRIRREAVPAVFVESTTNPKIPRLLAKEAGVVIVSELYTDSLGFPNTPGATFLGMARSNLETITTALH
jgi:zinc/manganese transport system substrate-binding protein